MTEERSRIDVHIQTGGQPVTVDRLNRALNNVPVSVTDLDIQESVAPSEETRFSLDGIIRGQETDRDIPSEIYLVGRVVAQIQNHTRCRIQQTAVDVRRGEREFSLSGHINPSNND